MFRKYAATVVLMRRVLVRLGNAGIIAGRGAEVQPVPVTRASSPCQRREWSRGVDSVALLLPVSQARAGSPCHGGGTSQDRIALVEEPPHRARRVVVEDDRVVIGGVALAVEEVTVLVVLADPEPQFGLGGAVEQANAVREVDHVVAAGVD